MLHFLCHLIAVDRPSAPVKAVKHSHSGQKAAVTETSRGKYHMHNQYVRSCVTAGCLRRWQKRLNLSNNV